MAYALDLLVRLLVLLGFLTGAVAMYYRFLLNSLWREEKRLEWWQRAGDPLFMFKCDLPEACRPVRRKAAMSLIAFMAVWLIGLAVVRLNFALGIYPVKGLP